ncbi:MAG: C4-dicarboxylate ABC transporter substrate-binding protein, partial [Pseudomonadota bacterium]|nr:C4-dicarboxylate ABC transporter substrate-binding protein [Pseudomonadota bacterium]
MRLTKLACTLPLFVVAAAVQAQVKWDMPTAYPANNFHTENVQQFATDV